MDISEKPKLLLAACCGPCSTAALARLANSYNITIQFFGSNIWPQEEYVRRLEALKTVNANMNNNIDIIICPYNEAEFLSTVQGLESQPEGGERCTACFTLRLKKAAQTAREGGFDFFTSTLSVSPHKNSAIVNEIGEKLTAEHGVAYLQSNFKKDGGFANSVQFSKTLGIYRQNYCGCRFSKK